MRAGLFVSACFLLEFRVSADSMGDSCPNNESAILIQQMSGRVDRLDLEQGDSMVSSRPTCKILKNFIRIGGLNYKRKKAFDAMLGRWGPRPYPWLINFQNDPPPAWLVNNTHFDTTVEIDSKQATQLGADFSAEVAPGVAVGASAHMDSKRSASYTLKRMTFQNQYKIVEWLNKEENAGMIWHLAQMTNPCIVTTAWILIHGDVESSSICGGGSVTAEFKAGHAKISGESCGSNQFSFNSGAVMAFEASKIIWDNPKKEKISKLVAIRP